MEMLLCSHVLWLGFLCPYLVFQKIDMVSSAHLHRREKLTPFLHGVIHLSLRHVSKIYGLSDLLMTPFFFFLYNESLEKKPHT